MEKSRLVANHDVFDHLRGGDAGEIAAARRHGEREGEPDNVVRWIADNRLVEVANFDFDAAVGTGYRTEIADVAVSADPDGWPLRDGAFPGTGEPLVELDRIAADVRMDAARHFATALLLEDA